MTSEELKQEANRLIKYFLASITVPEKDLWVNLSPYEKDRIIPNSFGLTEMGRDLLAQDYMLKQITASLIYPEDEVGKKFWKRIYEESQAKFGTTNIPVNTFNKVWIVPEKAVVYEGGSRDEGSGSGQKGEGEKAAVAYVVESKLKVMLEQDYVAMQHHRSGELVEPGDYLAMNKQLPLAPSLNKEGGSQAGFPSFVKEGIKGSSNTIASDIIRQIVIPELTREINEGANFAKLRQVYNSLILATWYKKKLRNSVLAQVYADKNKTAGIGYQNIRNSNIRIFDTRSNTRINQFQKHFENLNFEELKFVSNIRTFDDSRLTPEKIYNNYLLAFKKGVYNYIKEDLDLVTQQTTPRKYFSGGATFLGLGDQAMRVTQQIPQVLQESLSVVQVRFDQAMTNRSNIQHKKSEKLKPVFTFSNIFKFMAFPTATSIAIAGYSFGSNELMTICMGALVGLSAVVPQAIYWHLFKLKSGEFRISTNEDDLTGDSVVLESSSGRISNSTMKNGAFPSAEEALDKAIKLGGSAVYITPGLAIEGQERGISYLRRSFSGIKIISEKPRNGVVGALAVMLAVTGAGIFGVTDGKHIINDVKTHNILTNFRHNAQISSVQLEALTLLDELYYYPSDKFAKLHISKLLVKGDNAKFLINSIIDKIKLWNDTPAHKSVVIDLLKSAMVKSQNQKVRLAAMEVLIEVDDNPNLLEFMLDNINKEKNPFVRYKAMSILNNLDVLPEDYPLLMKSLGQGSVITISKEALHEWFGIGQGEGYYEKLVRMKDIIETLPNGDLQLKKGITINQFKKVVDNNGIDELDQDTIKGVFTTYSVNRICIDMLNRLIKKQGQYPQDKEIIPVLLNLLKQEPDQVLQAGVVDVLMGYNDVKIREAFESTLESSGDNLVVRVKMIKWICTRIDSQTWPFIIALMSTEPKDSVDSRVFLLDFLKDSLINQENVPTKFIEQLFQIILNESNQKLVEGALKALTVIHAQDQSIAEFFKEGLKRQDKYYPYFLNGLTYQLEPKVLVQFIEREMVNEETFKKYADKLILALIQALRSSQLLKEERDMVWGHLWRISQSPTWENIDIRKAIFVSMGVNLLSPIAIDISLKYFDEKDPELRRTAIRFLIKRYIPTNNSLNLENPTDRGFLKRILLQEKERLLNDPGMPRIETGSSITLGDFTKGGIDFTINDVFAGIVPEGRFNNIQFDSQLDSIYLSEINQTSGFYPVIIDISSLKDLNEYLGIRNW